MASSFLDKTGLTYFWNKIKSTFATKDVVSKTANGLAPQLPNETTTTKFLRQDGSWAVPPSGGGGSTVTITPSLSSGTKVADYSVDGSSGSLYAPSTAGLATETYVDNGLATKLTTSSLKFGEGTKSVSLTANGYAWSYFDIPSGRTMICPVGYYIAGTSNTQCVVYAYYADVNNKISMAIRTWASSAHTVTAHFYYLYI